MSKTKIEWAEETINPQRGCTKAGAGCTHCCALGTTYRQQFNKSLPDDVREASATCTEKANGVIRWTGRIVPVESHLEKLGPLRNARKPRRIFVGSLADLFHENADLDYVNRIFGRMASAPQHRFIVATKRPSRALQYCREYGLMPPCPSGEHWPDNVIPLVSIWDQDSADRLIPLLLQIPAKVRGVSVEPMLGPVNFRWTDYAYRASGETYREYLERNKGMNHLEALKYIDWVICGGESGPGARPMHPDWARSLRDQCVGAGVPFAFTGWGEWGPLTGPHGTHTGDVCLSPDGFVDVAEPDYVCFANESDGAHLRRVGKRLAGRLLDGQTWDQYPEAPHAMA